MLSRIVSKTTKNCRFFSSIKQALFTQHNTSDPFFKTSQTNPITPLETHTPQPQKANQSQIQATELENGITVVSETPDIPGTVGIQVLLNVGTSQEDNKTQGSLLQMKNTYYKTVLNTNETVNYGMVQQSGGDFTMDYNQEHTLYEAHQLEHDTVDIFNMVADCALEPRQVVAANVGIMKNKQSHAREANNNSGFDVNDTVFRAAYELQGLGMPLLGLPSNIENLNAPTLQSFQLKNITPEKIFIGGSNVENHEEFVELVSEKLSFIPKNDHVDTEYRKESGYVGGEVKQNNTSNRSDVIIAYESKGFTSEDAIATQLAAEIFGSHSSFALDQPHTAPQHRAYQNLIGTNSYVDDACILNFNFTNSGLFGIRLGGQAQKAQDLFSLTNDSLQGLTNITEAELAAAKASLLVKVLRGLESPHRRLTETLKNISTFGQVHHTEYANLINNVTVDQVNSAVSTILQGSPTVVINGGQASSINTSL